MYILPFVAFFVFFFLRTRCDPEPAAAAAGYLQLQGAHE